MNNHISKEFYESIQRCKKFCHEFIERAKETLRSCEISNIAAKCQIDMNKIILTSDDLLDTCQKVMDHAIVHEGECEDKKCKRYCEDIVLACKECIKSLGNVEIECEHDLKPCIDAISDAINKTKACMDVINRVPI